MTEIFDILLPIDTELRFFNGTTTVADRDFLMEMAVDRIANKYRGQPLGSVTVENICNDLMAMLKLFSLLRRWESLPELKLFFPRYEPPILYWADDKKFIDSHFPSDTKEV